jgi:hypothetical protein
MARKLLIDDGSRWLLAPERKRANGFGLSESQAKAGARKEVK